MKLTDPKIETPDDLAEYIKGIGDEMTHFVNRPSDDCVIRAKAFETLMKAVEQAFDPADRKTLRGVFAYCAFQAGARCRERELLEGMVDAK